ncbi:unnamed protein product [Trichobilharzia regenti]|nr:unnamed protein product [Trichobilharzia regenti]
MYSYCIIDHFLASEEINECIDKPCLSGGICLDLIGEYHCLCPTGRFGKNCELSGELVCSDHQSCGGEKDVRKNCTIQVSHNIEWRSK